jgi:pimeloyl-ACP methyl ester carboxylesterase
MRWPDPGGGDGVDDRNSEFANGTLHALDETLKLSQWAKDKAESAAQIGAYAALGSAGSALAWIAVSSLGIDHRRKLTPAIPDAEHRVIRTDAGNLFCYADTRASGRPLVLIHGVNAAASSLEMRPLFEHFRGQRPVYALDLPGFGFSSRRDQVYSPNVYKQAIVDVLDREISGEHPVDVIALSLASEFAALAAIESPHSIRSLTMISPTGFGSATMPPSESRRKGLSVPLWSQAFYDLLTSRPSLRHYLKKSFSGSVPGELVDYSYHTSHQPGARFAPLYFLSGQLFTPEVRRRVYNAVPVPTLVLYDQDGYTSFEYLEPFARNHMNWISRRVAMTRGLPHWERPSETAGALNYFWESLVPVIDTATGRARPLNQLTAVEQTL